MHTIRIIAAGFVLLGIMMLIGRLLAGNGGLAKAAMLFIPIWLAASIVNLWVGVSTAGYTVAQEFPILLVVFGVPAAVAFMLSRRFRVA